MTREEAINLVKQVFPCLNVDEKIREGFKTLIPELAESEDERVRKALVWHLKAGEDFVSNGVRKEECIAYLEKQKSKDDEEKYLDGIKRDWFERGKKEVLTVPELYGLEKQKEQKPKCTAYLDLSSNEFEACMLRYLQSAANRKDDAMIMIDTKGYAAQLMEIARKEQKPTNYDEYRMLIDGAKEEGKIAGRKEVLDNPKEYGLQKEQKHPDGCFTCDEYKKGYETGRLNGFTAGYNKAMKEQKQEWSEEDARMLSRCVKSIESSKLFTYSDTFNKAKDTEINWLKSLPLRFQSKETPEGMCKTE